MPFLVTEPHPTVQANAYTHAGRGGRGNTFRAPTSVTPAGGIPTPLTKVASGSSASHASHASHASTRFYAGRGGAGNAYPVSERRSVSLDDEYATAAAQSTTVGGYVGRGGAGNFYSSKSSSSSSSSSPSSSSFSGPIMSTADRIAQSIKSGVHGHPGHRRSSARKGSDASSVSGASTSSGEGRRSGFWGRMHR